MVLGINQAIGLIVVIISVIAYFTVKNSLINTNDSFRNVNENENVLLIGITSAQEHFEQRLSIRRTWLKLIKSERLKYYFLVGGTFCHIPPKYRLSHLSCEEWKPSLDDSVTNETVFSTITKENTCFRRESEDSYSTGFSFMVNHKIIIHRCGIKGSVLSNCTGSVQLTLTDAVTQNKIISSTFYGHNITNVDIVWNKIPRTILPSGFEGKLTFYGKCSLEDRYNERINLVLNDKTNMVKFLSTIDSKNKAYSYLNNICTNLGFSFSIKYVDSIRNLLDERRTEWLKWESHMKEMSDRLNKEIEIYGDILLLNIVDVYHNLPMKMLQFYQWLNPNDYKYVLKTDDDVFIDVPNVMKELKMDFETEWNWWSCFRVNWPVHKAGKWRELHINLTIYPDFPSGAGYILNKQSVKYIKENIKYLPSNIQGEDVALGLWLEKLKPKTHDGYHCRWSCNSRCQQNACNVMEVNVSDMLSVWEQYLACNSSLKCLCN